MISLATRPADRPPCIVEAALVHRADIAVLDAAQALVDALHASPSSALLAYEPQLLAVLDVAECAVSESASWVQSLVGTGEVRV